MSVDVKRHPVWPEGPDCDPGCPGPWSTYHDGYAWGFEKGLAQAEAERERLERWIEALYRDWRYAFVKDVPPPEFPAVRSE